jgi:hypothetical protein
MNRKHLLLFVALLVLPVAYADAAQVTINVPVEITNAPTGTTELRVFCYVGVGPPPPGVGTIWSTANARGGGTATINVPPSGNYSGTTHVAILAGEDATHYKCHLSGVGGQPPFEGQNTVGGPIPVDVPIRKK